MEETTRRGLDQLEQLEPSHHLSPSHHFHQQWRRGASMRGRRRKERSKKHWVQQLKDCFRNFIAFMFSNVGIIGLVIGYVIAGAFLFMRIESTAPKQLTGQVMRLRRHTAQEIWNVTHTANIFLENQDMWRNYVAQLLLDYQNATVDWIRSGYDGTDDMDYSKHWSFSGAFLYSLTVITTIGYGNIVPKTATGKMVTIVYAIIGMPLFLLYLSNIGDIMARSFKWVYATCYLCKGCPGLAKRRAERRQRRHTAEFPNDTLDGVADEYMKWRAQGYEPQPNNEMTVNSSESSEDEEGSDLTEKPFDTQTITVPVTICLTMMVGYIVGGAMLFKKYESWDLLDGSYFCFISLSTIGFGDLVPGDKIYSSTGTEFGLELSFIFCSMYLMLGMALIAMCFNLMQEEVIHKFRKTVNTIKYICRCKK